MATTRSIGDQSIQKRSGRGGPRPGAGRKPGSRNRPASIFVSRVKGLRVPDDAPPEVRELADRALGRVVDCLEERVPSHAAPSVLKAAAVCMELICEKIARGDGPSLADAVREAAARIDAGRTRALPGGDVVDAEVLRSTSTPVDPPPPTREEVAAARYQMTAESQPRRATRGQPLSRAT